MKKLNELTAPFLFLLFFACSISSSAQYHPLIDENKEWVIKAEASDIFNPFGGSTSYNYTYFKGDSIINGTSYKMLYQQIFYSSYNTGSINGITVDTTLQQPLLKAFMREDTMARQVFIIPDLGSTNLTENLLFDFSLNAGDTLHTLIGPFLTFSIPHEIDSVKFASIGNTMRSIHHFDSWGGYDVNGFEVNYMLEGVGGPGGVLNPFVVPVLGGQAYYEVVCYRENGDSLLGHYCNYADLYVVGLNENKVYASANLTLYPNPGSEQLIVEHDLTSTQELYLEVFSIQGKKHLSEMILSDQTMIDAAGLPQGIYFVQLSNEQGIVATQKWVKTN